MERSRLNWRKASYSTTNGGGCVEVATSLPGIIAVRDSKNADGPVLEFSPAAWQAFTAGVRHDEFDFVGSD
jgi:hypothetical protein